MYRLIIEHIIRRILREGEFTNLGIGSFRGDSHTDRTNAFVDRIQAGGDIPLKNDKSTKVEKVQVITRADKAKKNTDGTFYSADSSTDMEALKKVLPELGAGDQLYLYGTAGKQSITTVVKTPELGGKGKGHQRGSQAEAAEIANIQKQIDEFNTDKKGISIVGAGDGIVGIQKVEGVQKADFKFIDAQGNAVAYIQHKSPKHQQMSGIGRKPIRDFEEVQAFAQKVFDIVNKSPEKRLKGPYSEPVKDSELKKLAVYGNPQEGPKGVQFYCIGPMELKSLGEGIFKLTIAKGKGFVFTGDEIPDGNEAPTLVATYRAGRNQKVPRSKDVIPDTRIGIYPKSYVSNS
jgi:hypothetical protein